MSTKRKENIVRSILLSQVAFLKYRDSKSKPRITVCLVKDPETKNIARGISICSSKDLVETKIGRHKAFGRAIQALSNEKTSLPIQRHEAMETLADCGVSIFYFFKSEFNPKLLAYEEKLLQ